MTPRFAVLRPPAEPVRIDRSKLLDPVTDMRLYLARTASLPIMLSRHARLETIASIGRDSDRERFGEAK